MKKRFVVYANTSTVSRSRKSIRAAEETEDTRVSDMSDSLKDDFDFALDGFDKMVRNGNVAEALSIMTTLSDAINKAIQDAAAQIGQ